MNILYVALVKILGTTNSRWLFGGPVVWNCLDNNAREYDNIDIYLSMYYLFI